MFCVVLITAKNKLEAQKIAKGLLNKRLCACVNIIDKIDSLFWWENRIDKVHEALLIIKTKESLLTKLISETKKLHSYSLPEIIALPIVGGSKDYLDWVKKETR